MFNLNKKLIIIACSALVFVTVVIIGVIGYHNYQINQSIKSYQTQIADVSKSFQNAKSDSDKFNDLKVLENDYQKYQKKDRQLGINAQFESKIASMKNYFVVENDKTISDNTISNLDIEADVNKITTDEANLKSVLSTIQNEDNIVYTASQISSYGDKINTLTTSYDIRVKSIQDAITAATDAKAKTDAETAAKIAADKLAQEKITEKARVSSTPKPASSSTPKPAVTPPSVPEPKYGTTTLSNPNGYDWQWDNVSIKYTWMQSILNGSPDPKIEDGSWGGIYRLGPRAVDPIIRNAVIKYCTPLVPAPTSPGTSFGQMTEYTSAWVYLGAGHN